ncbi:MAG: DUF484 family protein [Gammaproteobacteria bacterium]|nr:MAG: DUF484 family protein [Gammaproteobacteria bacterium]
MTEPVDNKNTDTLTEEQVASYLRAHPDFFLRHDHLLNELRLPHESGRAISLVERQVALFREQRDTLDRQLRALIETARQNDRFFEKSKRLIMNLLEAQTLEEAVIVLEDSFLGDFNVHFCSLTLLGMAPELPVPQVRWQTAEELERAFPGILKENRARCGRFSENQNNLLFGADAGEVGSAALIPLHYGEPTGVLAIGHRDSNYFDSSMGSMFLSYISDSLARMLPSLIQSGWMPARAQQV